MKKTVLIVDDDPNTRKLVRDLLVLKEFETIEAPDGKQALAAARESMPVLIIMDVQMPGLDGYDTTRALKSDSRTAHIPVVALTSLAMPGDREAVFQAGYDDYMPKPLDTRLFMKKLPEWVKPE